MINDATAITIFFRRQAEKSLGLLRIKLQKLTFCRNAIYECTVLIYLYLYNSLYLLNYFIGSGGHAGVGDSIVNQLLSIMDGVEQPNNFLVIGMTNRKDMIDEALLRPGRIEVHVEISMFYLT